MCYGFREIHVQKLIIKNKVFRIIILISHSFLHVILCHWYGLVAENLSFQKMYCW